MRRTRIVRVFSNEPSCLRLICSLLMETSQEWKERIYLRCEVSANEEGANAAA